MVKQSAVDRIEKALGNFKARVIRQQLGVLLFHPQKKIDVGTFPFGNAAQLLYHQANVVIVEMDTLLHRLLYGVPVRTIAWRDGASDDVLFQRLDDPTRFTVVHLTWRGRTEVDKRFPTVELDGSFQHFLDEEAPWNDLAPEGSPPVDDGRAE